MSDEIELTDDDIIGVENDDNVRLYIDTDHIVPYIYLTDYDIMELARLRGLSD